LISQWTGTEAKGIEKIWVGILAGTLLADAMKVTQALIDFIYHTHLLSHTDSTIQDLEAKLSEFHQYKSSFIELGVRAAPHFNFLKIHMLQHYRSSIQLLGALDSYNTKSLEQLHIDFAKEAY
jgi:hypothetical protein